MDFNARPRTLGQRFGKLLANVSGPINVGLQVNRFLRSANRRQHGGKDFVAISQTGNPVAAHDGRTEQLTHRAQELRIIHAILGLDLVLDSPPMIVGGATTQNRH